MNGKELKISDNTVEELVRIVEDGKINESPAATNALLFDIANSLKSVVEKLEEIRCCVIDVEDHSEKITEQLKDIREKSEDVEESKSAFERIQMRQYNGYGIPVDCWKKYEIDNKPDDIGKYVVVLEHQGDLGLSTYLWAVDWNGEEFKDYAGCDDIKKGAKVKYFAKETDLIPISKRVKL